jgi:hypothetical protein
MGSETVRGDMSPSVPRQSPEGGTDTRPLYRDVSPRVSLFSDLDPDHAEPLAEQVAAEWEEQ